MFCECRPYIVIFDLECEDFFYTTRNELDLTTEYPVGEASDEDTADYMVDMLDTGNKQLGVYN